MRIVIATSVFPPMINGVAVFSGNLARGLVSRGHEVLVLTPSQNGRRHDENFEGVKVCYLKSISARIYPDQIHKAEKKGPFYKNSLKVSVFPKREIFRILDEFKPDVIHSQGSDPIGVSAIKYARKQGIRVISTEHNRPEVLTEPIHLPKFLRKGVNRQLSSFFRRNLKKADVVTMPTELSAEELYGSRENHVKVISNGVDLAKFKPGNPKSTIYNIYGIPKGALIILYIGRLDPEKKVDVVLRAFSDFLDKHKLDSLSKTLFVVVGDGVDKKRLERVSKELGISKSVKFLGRVVGDDLYELYKIGDVFATASEIETQGIVLIEAAATGLPLIAVDAGAVSEVCRDNENGILLKPGDVSGIAQAFEKILGDPKLREKMSEKSIEVAAEHSLEKTIDEFLKIYQNGV